MFFIRISILLVLLITTTLSFAQVDSTIESIKNIPTKYLRNIDNKIELYSNRITTRTEKTLGKLSRWENKIQGILLKVSPETAERLFGNNQPTFTSLLQQLKKGEALVLSYQAPYNKYNDELNTSLKYLTQQKEQLDSGLIKKIEATSSRMQDLVREEDKNDVLLQFIKDRKKQLIEQAFKHIGKSKYLVKINKEVFYYAETLKNYKEIFADTKKTEAAVQSILSKIPAFKKFMQNNSQMASIFGPGAEGALPNLSGLQTRAGVQNLIQDRISSNPIEGMQQLQQTMQIAHNQLNRLKGKLLKSSGGGGGVGDIADFQPNMEKTKTFLQRFEFGFNLQFAKTNSFLPATSDIALNIGYRLNHKSIMGLGASYKLGIGNIRQIRLTHEGIGLRSFIDWKLKKQIFISGGFEINHFAEFENIAQLKNYNAWQKSALLGLNKKLPMKSKFFKSSSVQVLYDFLYREHIPVSQPFLFRVGNTF